MAAENEIERLLVRLVGDATEYQRMLADSRVATQEAAKSLEATTVAAGQLMADALKSIGAKFKELGRTAIAEFSNMETTQLRLQGILEANERPVEELMDRYYKFAAAMQKITVVGDDEVAAMLQVAESMGVTGDAAIRASRNAIALSSAIGMGTHGAMRYAVMLEQGSTQMLGRFIPTLRLIKDEAERARVAQEMLGKMFTVAEREAQSYSGQVKQLKNDFGDLMEEVGKIVTGWLRPLVAVQKEVVKWFQSLSAELKGVIVTIGFFTTSISALLVVLGILMPAIVSTWALVKILSIALWSLSMNPIVLTVAGITALAVGIAYVSGLFDPLIAKLKKMYTGATEGNEEIRKSLQFRPSAADEAKQKIEAWDKECNKASESVKELIKSMEEELEITEITTDSQRELAIYKLGIKKLSDAEREYAFELAHKLDLRDKDRESMRKISDAMTSVQDRLQYWGKSAEYIHAYKLALDESTKSQGEMLLSMLGMEEKQKEHDKQMEEGKRILEQYMTPQEKYLKTIGDLQKLLDVGAIDDITFSRAFEAAGKELDKLQEKATITIKWDTAEFGSAEALARIEEFRQGKMVVRPARPVLPAVEPEAGGPWRGHYEPSLNQPYGGDENWIPAKAENQLPTIADTLKDLRDLARAHWKGPVVQIEEAKLHA